MPYPVSPSLQFCEAGPVILTLVYRRGDRGLRRLSLVLKATSSELGLCQGQVLDHHTLGHQWSSCVPVPGQLCPQEMPVVVNVTGWPQFPHLITGCVMSWVPSGREGCSGFEERVYKGSRWGRLEEAGSGVEGKIG